MDKIIKIQGESNCLHVSQSVSWFTSLLILDKSRDIVGAGWDIFLKFFGEICGMLVNYVQIILNFFYVCQPVSWLTYLLKLDRFRGILSSRWCIFLKILGDMLRMFYTRPK